MLPVPPTVQVEPAGLQADAIEGTRATWRTGQGWMAGDTGTHTPYSQHCRRRQRLQVWRPPCLWVSLGSMGCCLTVDGLRDLDSPRAELNAVGHALQTIGRLDIAGGLLA